jgi:hypothetical protein
MAKPLLAPKKQINMLQKIKKLYNSTSQTYPIPNKLYHYFKDTTEQSIEKKLNKVNQQGLEISKPRQTTSFIDKKVNRPRGIYFWGSKIKEEANIQVAVSQLDKSKLYAFPHSIADEILNLTENHQVPDSFWQELKRITKAVPFNKYSGEFKAEFIYTHDIPPEIIKINQNH